MHRIPAEGEVPPEETPSETTDGQEPRPKLAPLPQTVFSLCAEEEFLLSKIAALPEVTISAICASVVLSAFLMWLYPTFSTAVWVCIRTFTHMHAYRIPTFSCTLAG